MTIKELEAYELIREEDLPDIKSTGYLLRHRKSGARIALISNSDENKVFSIAFRTPPEDSTGVAHILEHSVLCGSRDFPVKDPFVELVKGSLNTFLNAMTYPDKTVYPVASCNDKDFQNLLHVYLDAVFYPNIYKHDEIFRQEGWSYELESADGELNYNGVVYNEMKGVFSSPDGVLERGVMNSLFPGTCYGVESGGDPDVIPELTYENFLNFHRKYYHPSNSYIYLYGNMDMAEKLTWIDENYLSHFDAAPVNSEIKPMKPFDKVQDVDIEYPISDEEPLEDNSYLAYSKVIGDALDTKKIQAFDILDYALLSAPGAPLEKALLEAGIGKDISGTFESEVRQPYFSIISKSANVEDKERFKDVIENTLRQAIEKGIDEKALLAGINYYEFRAREADFGNYPKGLMYGLQALESWIYDEDKPFEVFHFLNQFAFMREQVGKGYFEGLIKSCLLENTHGSVISMKPVRGLAARKDAKLAEKLASYKDSLSPEELQKIEAATNELSAYQEAPDRQEDIEKIPILNRSDITRDVKRFSNIKYHAGNVKILCHDYETNGIGYLRLVFDISHIQENLWPFVGVLQSVLGVIDTENYGYGDLFNEINLETGGVGTLIETYGRYGEGHEEEFTPYFEFKGKALYEKLNVVFGAATEIAARSKLGDEKRLLEIISQNKARLQTRFLTAGHQVAVTRAMSYSNSAYRFKDMTEGIAYYDITKKLEENFDDCKGYLIQILEYLARKIFTYENLLISYTGSPDMDMRLQREVFAFMDTLFDKESADKVVTAEALDWAAKLTRGAEPSRNEGFTCASKVQYVARVGNFLDAGLSYTGAMNILRPILSYDYLWNNVRVQGGAYGCMSGANRNGDGYFVSYRDPHLERTNKVYEGVPEFLRNFEADERGMTKYIIGTVSDMDIPLTPVKMGDRSLSAYLTKTPLEALQKERGQVLDAEPENIRALAPLIQAILDCGSVCVIGSEEKIKAASGLFGATRGLL